MLTKNLRFMCLLLTVFMLMTIIFVGCSKSEGKKEETKATAEEPSKNEKAEQSTKEKSSKISGKLKVAVYQVPVEDSVDPVTGEEIKGYNALFSQFTEKFPDVEIDAFVVPLDGWQAKFQALLLSQDVDVLLGSFQDYYPQGLIMNLYELAERDKVWDKYIPAVRTASRVRFAEGHIMGLPADLDVASVAYDKKIFEDWGVEPLSMNPTVEELEEKLPKVTGKNPKTGQETYGLYINGKWQSLYSLDIIGEGFNFGDMNRVAPNKSVFKINTPENKKKIQKWQGFLKYCPPGFLTGQGLENWGRENNNIAVVIYCQPQQMAEALKNQLTDRFIVTDGLKDKDGRIVWCDAMTWGVAKSTKNLEAAWELVKYCSGYEGQKFRHENYNYLPSVKNTDFVDSSKNPYVKHFISAASEPRHKFFPNWVITGFRPWLNEIMAKTVEGANIDLDRELEEIQKKGEQWANEQKPLDIK